jgi:DNA mismatch repair protein MutL
MEQIELLKTLSKCTNPFNCPHGRPTFIKLSKNDIEKTFHRR